MTKSTVILEIERFRDNEDIEYRVPSKMEKLGILQHIMKHGTLVALYYDGPYKFILTSVLDVNEQGIWLDTGPFPAENKLLVRSKKITFVSEHHNAKVQFAAQNIKDDLFENGEAFFLEMPNYLLRIQRRGFFRLKTPIIKPIKCIIPVKPDNPDNPTRLREVVIRDIGWEGVGLLCEEQEAELVKGTIFQDCRISLPDIGMLTVDIKVRSSSKFTTRSNVVQRHVGCEFIGLDNRMTVMLQLYISRRERELLIDNNEK